MVRFTRRSWIWIVAVGCLVLLVILATATPGRSQDLPPDPLAKVAFNQRLNQQVPLDLPFHDSDGQTVQIGDFLGARPAILTLGYYNCPNLCDAVRQGLLQTMENLPFTVGKDFDVIAVSIDSSEKPPLANSEKIEYVKNFGHPEAASGIHFLTGDQSSIAQVAAAIGFQYYYDQATRQFAHPTGIVLLTPQGKVSRYFYGVEFSPQDVRLGLVEASSNHIGTLTDQILLRCFHYDPTTGKYTLLIVNVVDGVAILSFGLLAAFIVTMLRRERRHKVSASSEMGE